MIRAPLDTSTIRKFDNDCTSGTRKHNYQKTNSLYHMNKLQKKGDARSRRA